ncbi:sugar kinase [Ruicaihuangia caeni]|uniref:Sugar kinase n=1 Tax=Ruicaihuangia caeni TaxID=3042517 RepID=A0AAW6TCA0_9MICO|nr:sugar kinase [Klugiella sp. YN-L-19]MDI2099000.1 sugar kinase [Klugiella sp. YN-L-19]
MSDERRRVVCLGETMAQVTPIRRERLAEASEFALNIGGAESTVALYLADRGHDAAWISDVGDDPLGERMLEELRHYGVDVTGVQRVPHAPTGVYFKDPHPDGTTKVHYYRAGSAASRMTVAALERIDWASTRVLHLTGITPRLSQTCAELVEAGIERAQSSGVLVSFDVNYRPGLWSPREAAPVLEQLAAASDIVFVGLDEAETVWGPRPLGELHQRLAPRGVLVVKDGGVEAIEVTATRSTVVAARAVDVVEPVGAGDAFAAGYLAGLLEGADAAARLDLGHELAARALGSTRDFAPSTTARLPKGADRTGAEPSGAELR